MKKLAICLMIISSCAFAQNRKTIDPINPLSKIEVEYSVNGNLIIYLILNSIETERVLENLAISSEASSESFSAFFSGEIVWDSARSDPKENIISGSFSPLSTETPYKYGVDIKNELGAVIPEVGWNMIKNAKIKYEMNGNYYELPSVSIYPPPTDGPAEKISLSVEARVKKIGLRKGEIKITSNPSGTSFEVQEIVLTKNSTSTKYDVSTLGQNRFANNGVINMTIKTDFDLNLDASYKVKVDAKKIGSEASLNSPVTDIVLIDAIPQRVVNRPQDYVLTINDNNTIKDKEVRTEGSGELGIEFATIQFANVINVNRESLGSGDYTFTLTGLSQIPNDSYSYYYYTSNGVRIGQPYLIVKKAPVVSNFQFNGVESNVILADFNLPSYVDEESISLSLIGSNQKILNVGGSMLINRDINDNTKFNAKLPSGLTELVASDTIVDLTLIVNYNGNPLYSIGVKMINQKLINEKFAELVAETAQKPNKRSKERISGILTDIVEIGKAFGNAVSEENPEFVTAVENLSEGDGEKVKNTIKDIGSWAALIGKIVLPVLAL